MMTWRLHHFDAYGEDCSLSACLTLTCNPLVCIVAADLVEMMCTDKTGSAICWTEVKTVFVPSAQVQQACKSCFPVTFFYVWLSAS